jgi:hypothetical protein
MAREYPELVPSPKGKGAQARKDKMRELGLLGNKGEGGGGSERLEVEAVEAVTPLDKEAPASPPIDPASKQPKAVPGWPGTLHTSSSYTHHPTTFKQQIYSIK